MLLPSRLACESHLHIQVLCLPKTRTQLLHPQLVLSRKWSLMRDQVPATVSTLGLPIYLDGKMSHKVTEKDSQLDPALQPPRRTKSQGHRFQGVGRLHPLRQTRVCHLYLVTLFLTNPIPQGVSYSTSFSAWHSQSLTCLPQTLSSAHHPLSRPRLGDGGAVRPAPPPSWVPLAAGRQWHTG